ncbi:MAG: peptide ABC transporter permease, partial [Chloroflexi bacterium]
MINSTPAARPAPAAPTVKPLDTRKPSTTLRRRFWRSRRAVFGLSFLILISAIALLAPLIAPYDAGDQDPSRAQLPPLSTSESGTYHLLGTDALGRDLLSRMMYGGR